MRKVSVVVAVHNGEKTIARCVDSILAQSMPDCEIIVVDDGSTDGTRSILEACRKKSPELRLIHCADNRGQREAQYLGYLAATGEYISALDADDYVGPSRFDTLYRLAAHAPVVVSAMTRVEADGSTHPIAKPLPPGLVQAGDFFPVLNGEPWEKLIRRDLVLAGCERYRLFHGSTSWRQSANMPVFWAMLQAGRIFHTEQTDYFYVNTPGSVSKSWTPERADQELSNVLRRYLFLAHEFPHYRGLVAGKFRHFLESHIWVVINARLSAEVRQGLEGRYQYLRNLLGAAE